MAVEIPVVIDIEGAFEDAGKRVKVAMQPLQRTIDKLTEELGVWKSFMSEANIGDAQFIESAKNIQNISNALAEADYQMRRYASNEGSIKQMSEQLAELNRRWTEMGAAQKYASDGKTLSADAQKLRDTYKQITENLHRQGKSLSELAAQEEKLLRLKNQSAQKSKYEDAILNARIKTVRVLSEQQRILTERLQTSVIGTSQYYAYADALKTVNAELAKTRKDVDATSSSMGRYGNSVSRAKQSTDALSSSLRNQSGLWAQLKSSAAMYFSIFGGIRVLKNLREVTAQLELQRVSLGSLLQDTDKATELFRDIKAAALKSPFEIKDLVTYTKQLSAYRVESDKLFDVTMRLADVSAGLGVDMNRLILAYGQVRAASVLRGQELRQFTEAGIPLVEKLAEKFQQLGREGTTTADVFELISKRAVPFSMIEEIFKDMTSAGGEFYNMQEKQSETLWGRWQKLKDAVTIMYDEIGNTSSVHKAMEDVIEGTLRLMRAWRDVARFVGVGTAALVTYSAIAKSSAAASAALTSAEAKRLAVQKAQTLQMPRFIAALLGETKAKEAAHWATTRLRIAQYKLATANTVVTRSFWRLYAAIMKNPYAAAGAAIIGLAVGITQLVKSANGAKFSIDAFEGSISNMQSTMRKQTEISDLIAVYEELSKKTNLTADEQARLARVTKELAKAFPAAVSGFNEQANAIDINIEKVKELTKAEEDLLRLDAENQKRDAEKQLVKLKERREAIDKLLEEGGYRASSTFAEVVPFTKEEISNLSKELRDIVDNIDRLQTDIDRLDKVLNGGVDEGEDNATTQTLVAWKQKISDIQDEKVKAGAAKIFESDDIQNFKSVLDFSKELKKRFDEVNAALTANVELRKSATGEALDSIEADIKANEETLNMIEAMRVALGIIFKTTSTHTRDTRLQNLRNDISEVTNAYKKFLELRKYKSEDKALIDIDRLFPQLGGQAPTYQNTLSKLQAMRDDIIAKLAKSPKDKTLLDMQRTIETEISNLQFDDLKNELDARLKKLSEDIKRSETARNFFSDIIGMTGDEQLAATMSVSVYGGIGKEFKDRMQQQLNEALSSLDAEQITKELREAFETGDFDVILANLDKFPEKWQETLKKMSEDTQQFNANQVKTWLKELQKAKTYGEQRVEIAKKTAQRISEINESSLPQSEKETLIAQYRKKQVKDLAKVEYEAFKDSPIYIQMFENLEAASTKAMSNMRNRIAELKEQWKDLDPTELKEMQRRLDELDDQMAGRNPFRMIIDGIKQYRNLMRTSGTSAQADATALAAENARRVQEDRQAQAEAEYADAKKAYDLAVNQYAVDDDRVAAARERLRLAKANLDIQKRVTDRAKEEADNASKVQEGFAKARKALMKGAEGLQKWSGYVSNASEGIRNIIDTFGSDDLVDTFDIITGGIQQTLTGAGDLAMGTARLLAGGDLFGGISQIIKGLGSVIAGIFGTAKKLKIKELNKQIEVQAVLLDNLAESYEKLEKIIDNTFGADRIYTYNEQLKNLLAQQKAAEEQLRLERAKGNKADKDQIASYEKAIRDTKEAIDDMKGGLGEFFAGTDLTSASSEFATAWIEAYKSFASTTAAMREKFDEMVQSMVTNSIGAKLVQTILGPLFNEIDAMALSGGELSASEIAQIAQSAPEYIAQINNAMTTMMNQLGAAGYNMRQQVGGFTGISRNIATASEESINGLAAGINTQNFYISYVPLIYNEVMLVRQKLVGEVAGEGEAAGEPAGMSYQDQVLSYISTLPQMRDDMYAIRMMLDKVIKPVGVKTTHYVSVNM